MPRHQHGSGFLQHRRDRQRTPREEHGDDRLAGGHDAVEELLLRAGQTEVEAVVVFTGPQRRLAEREDHDIGFLGLLDGFVELLGRRRLDERAAACDAEFPLLHGVLQAGVQRDDVLGVAEGVPAAE